ncbi:MAG: ABC transporter permease [Kiritimatiellae bacterium]|nr:ABC transporter permease [Kiritimatiellia bacterium]
MNFFMILKVAMRAIWRNKTRSLLTALGIIVGIAAVIAVVSIGQGASTMMVSQINSMGNNMIMIFPASRNTGGVRTGSGGAQTLTAEDGQAIAEDISYFVRCVSPIVRANGQVIYQENNWATQVQGVSVDFPEVRNWNVSKGVFFDKDEQRQGSRVCVIGQTVSDNLFGENDPIGKVIRIKNMPFKVLGVMEKKGSNNFGQDQDDLIIAPYTTVKRVLQNSIFNNVNMLNVSLYSLDDTEAAKKDISALLRQRHKLGRNADDDFDLRDMAEISKTIGSVSSLMTILLTTVAAISLVVGGIGIMNIMLVSVTERTREIGLRMAIGATPLDILLQFITESILLSTVGGLIGVIFGVAGAKIVGDVQHWPILITPSSIIVSFLFSAMVGVFFGFYPAFRASRLHPIDCLRYE